jgi:Leucine-rich repeat (LRR) protein
LNLNNNQISSIPLDIGYLKNLKILSLANNKLTTLPREMKDLSNLKTLFLGGNNFSKAEMEQINNWLPKCKIEWGKTDFKEDY